MSSGRLTMSWSYEQVAVLSLCIFLDLSPKQSESGLHIDEDDAGLVLQGLRLLLKSQTACQSREKSTATADGALPPRAIARLKGAFEKCQFWFLHAAWAGDLASASWAEVGIGSREKSS